MSDQKINPEKVTKPIQLLAAWLTGLVIVDGGFLLTASNIGTEHWTSHALVVASIINVPIFLVAIFLLQTKFRPEMQEDVYYSKYLENQVSPETGQLEQEKPKDSALEIYEFKENLTLLTERIESLTYEAKGIEQKAEIEELSSFTNELVETIENSSYPEVSLNDLLPSYSNLIDQFQEAGIKITSTFGSSNETPEEPKVFTISCGNYIDVPLFQKIVQIGFQNGATTVSYSDGEYSVGKIYVGSYGYRDTYRKQINLDQEFCEKIMEKHLSMSKLIYLLSN